MQEKQSFVTYYKIDFDEVGFWPPAEKSYLVKWTDIVRVALCCEIHSIALADWDYWAFQTKDPDVYPWVEINDQVESKAFSHEIYRRYGKPEIPPMKDWVDANYCIRAFVIYPEEDIGKSMYVTKKKHWWSWSGSIYHAYI